VADTATRISILANGIRDTSGAVVASGCARFYSPGTLVAATVYSDDACTTARGQPVVLNAAGQATVCTLGPVRMVAKDSTETTTYYDGIVNLRRAESVYMTEDGFNSGNETTVGTAMATASPSFGEGFQYKESTPATVRNMTSVIRNIAIQAEDYGVVADGVTDDTDALQDAIARVVSLGGGKVILPAGTMLISSALTIDTAGVSIEGQGRGISIIKQSSTSANTINVTLVSGDCKLFLKRFSVTASTTSSGVGINVTVGNYIVIEEVAVGLHRTAFDTDGITGAELRRCFVDSTDGNGSALGIDLGLGARAIDCEVNAASDVGTGIRLNGVDARATDCYVSNYILGISAAAARGNVRGCHVSGATTGITLGAANCVARNVNVTTATTGISVTAAGGLVDGGYIASCTTGVSLTAANGVVKNAQLTSNTTGVSVGAVASCRVIDNIAASNTTDISVNASATLFMERGNTWTSTVTNSATSNIESRPIRNIATQTQESGVFNFTPVPAGATSVHICRITVGAAGDSTVTTVNTATTNICIGDTMWLVFSNGDVGVVTNAWGTQYTTIGGGSPGTTTGPLAEQSVAWLFRWDGTNWIALFRGMSSAVMVD
jgi:hypothetical protein